MFNYRHKFFNLNTNPIFPDHQNMNDDLILLIMVCHVDDFQVLVLLSVYCKLLFCLNKLRKEREKKDYLFLAKT